MPDVHWDKYNKVDWWLDRLGNLEFIEDQKDMTAEKTFYFHHIRIADKTGCEFDTLTM